MAAGPPHCPAIGAAGILQRGGPDHDRPAWQRAGGRSGTGREILFYLHSAGIRRSCGSRHHAGSVPGATANRGRCPGFYSQSGSCYRRGTVLYSGLSAVSSASHESLHPRYCNQTGCSSLSFHPGPLLFASGGHHAALRPVPLSGPALPSPIRWHGRHPAEHRPQLHPDLRQAGLYPHGGKRRRHRHGNRTACGLSLAAGAVYPVSSSSSPPFHAGGPYLRLEAVRCHAAAHPAVRVDVEPG